MLVGVRVCGVLSTMYAKPSQKVRQQRFNYLSCNPVANSVYFPNSDYRIISYFNVLYLVLHLLLLKIAKVLLFKHKNKPFTRIVLLFITGFSILHLDVEYTSFQQLDVINYKTY